MNKAETRRLYRNIRNTVSHAEKEESDKRIFTSLINSNIYKSSDLLLVYVSFGSEVETRNIIEHALNVGKRVAVPLCVDKEMSFYEIHSLSELIIGKFGIPTVEAGNNSEVSNFSKALCIVPALCFDVYGARIGYGGGYYDRFLSANKVVSVGLSYERCLCGKIPHEKHDIKVDYILTEKCLRNSKCKEVSTYE